MPVTQPITSNHRKTAHLTAQTEKISHVFHHFPGILAATYLRIMLRNDVLAFTRNSTPVELGSNI